MVNRGETVDIPYWPNYTGVSDMDLVCRYYDYTVINLTNHVPLNIEVVQVTYAWIALEFLVHQYWIMPKLENITRVYFGIKGNVSIGCATTSSLDQHVNDEFGWYDEEKNLGIFEDLPGNPDDDCCVGPIGFTLIGDGSADSLLYTWHDGRNNGWNIIEQPNTDEARYNMMSVGINHDPLQSDGRGNFLYIYGPFEVAVGQTLHTTLEQNLRCGYRECI